MSFEKENCLSKYISEMLNKQKVAANKLHAVVILLSHKITWNILTFALAATRYRKLD